MMLKRATVAVLLLTGFVLLLAQGEDNRAGAAPSADASAVPSQLIAWTGPLDKTSRFSSLVVSRADGSVVRRVSVPRRDGLAVEADFSPSGRLIAYAARPNGRECCRDLYVRSVFKTLKRRLTGSPNTEDSSPAYGPNNKVFFVSFQRAAETARIQSISANGGNRQTVFAGGSGVSIPSYSDLTISPTGKRIAFTGERGNAIGIYLVDSDGTGVRPLVEFDFDEDKGPKIVDLDYSADGKSVAYIFWPETQGPTFSDVHVVNIATKASRRLTSDPNRYEDRLVFAPDNRRVGVTTAHKPQNITITIANRSRKTLRLGRAPSASLLDWAKVAGS